MKALRFSGIKAAPIFMIGALFMACGSEPAPTGVDNQTADHCADSGDGVVVDLERPACKKLSSYGFFQVEGGKLVPNDGVVAYTLSTPLFSDYAAKHRHIWLPAGTSADWVTGTTFKLPQGSVVAKTFTFPRDLRDPSKGERLVETRLLVHEKDGWKGYPYIWNDAQTDAELSPAGGTFEVSWIDEAGDERSTAGYLVPNSNQCKGCHEAEGKIGLIGPKARYLNLDYAYEDGTANQLDRLAQAGYLTGVPAFGERPQAVFWDDEETGTVEERARTYLDINCAHCHNPKGPASTSGLFLTYSDTPYAAMTTPETARLGVCKKPVAAGRGSGGLTYDVVPGDPDASILVYRMETNDPGRMMPELGRSMVHEEGMALVRQWISELSGSCD